MSVFDDIGHIAADITHGIEHGAENLVQAAGHMFEGGGPLVGIMLAGGAFFVAGPGYVIPAFIGGSIGTGMLIRQRNIYQYERDFVEAVIGKGIGKGNLPPNEKIFITNLLGIDNCAFTAVNEVQDVLVNIGDGGFDHPLTHQTSTYPKPGKLFIHEMTHVMQYQRSGIPMVLMCKGAINQLTGGNYNPGERGLPWQRYNMEQQATIVDEWFAPVRFPTLPAKAPAHPFWRYIRDDVRRVPAVQHKAYGFNFTLPHDVPEGPNAQSHWRYCGRCRSLYFDASPASKAVCPAGGIHEANGMVFVLPYGIAEGPLSQRAWRYCSQCQSMFYSGDGSFNGTCSTGGQHNPAGSWDFVLPHQPLAGKLEQDQWRYCSKCRSLFYDADPANKGQCPAGDGHFSHGLTFVLKHSNFEAVSVVEHTSGVSRVGAGAVGEHPSGLRRGSTVVVSEHPGGSGPHNPVTVVETPSVATENQWRCCRKCLTLFNDADPADKGTCPAGEGHLATDEVEFVLVHDSESMPDSQSGWRRCGKCRTMFYGALQGHGGACSAGGEHVANGFNFQLEHQPYPGDKAQEQWRYCASCRVMFYGADGGTGGACSVI